MTDYPVFTRKAMTDLCYMACVRKLLAARERIFPQFATHNALTVASVIEDAGGVEGFEFQRLHGMGEALYEALARRTAGCRLPRLRAGRRPSRSPRLSGAAASGERRQFLVRFGRRRSERADRGDLAPPAKLGSPAPARRAQSENSAAARSLSAGAAKFGRHRVRRPRKPRCAARRGSRRHDRGCAKPRRSSTASRCPASSAR